MDSCIYIKFFVFNVIIAYTTYKNIAREINGPLFTRDVIHFHFSMRKSLSLFSSIRYNS